MSLVVSVSLVILLVLANAFFVAAEFALVKVRSTQLELQARRGSLRARVGMTIIENLDGYLSASQLGITLASLGLGWIGEPVVAKLLEIIFLQLGIDSPELAHKVALPTAFAVITFLHIVVGEIAPKTIAIQAPKEVTLWVGIPFKIFYTVSYPLIWLLNGASNSMLKVLGVRPASEHELAHSAEELHLIVSESERNNQLSLVAKDLLVNTLDLRRRMVRQVMTPRTKVVYLSTKKTLLENLDIARKSQHTRFPLGDPDLDNVLGLIHVKDLIWLLLDQKEQGDLRSIMRPVMFVPEFVVLEKLLRSMQARRNQAALVVDEFGSIAGMVTFENIMEEIVGDIQDEFDSERPLWQKIGNEEWLCDGAAPLYELKDLLGLDLQSKDATTIGGYIVERLGAIPHEGEQIELNGVLATIKQVDRRRVKQVALLRQQAGLVSGEEGSN
jgi:CBS domain containing-hemolysin-like protein